VFNDATRLWRVYTPTNSPGDLEATWGDGAAVTLRTQVDPSKAPTAAVNCEAR
jgi:hypothetical protein